MTAVAIDRFVARYVIPRSRERDQARLQQVMTDAVHRVLEGAIERAGVPRDGHLCIRDVHAVVTLGLRQPDSALADQVGNSIAAAIRAAASGPAPSAVYYCSRVQALIDMAVGALQGAFDRSWAWQQVGLWPADGPQRSDAAAETILRTLAANPTVAVAVIAHLARRHASLVDALVTRTMGSAVWIEVARSTLAAAGGRAALFESAGTLVPAVSNVDAASRMIARSAIAGAMVHRHVDLPAGVRRAIAVLVLAEVEPAALGADSTQVSRSLAAVAHAIASAGGRSGDMAPAPIRLRADDVVAGDAAHAGDGSRTGGAESVKELQAEIESLELPDLLEGPGPAFRQHATSRVAGLMYLLNVVARLNLAQSAGADPRLVNRGLRWILHQLGMALAGADAADPAVLAFAGLPPDAPPPSAQETPATAGEREAIAETGAAITAAVRDLLGRDEPDAKLIAFVCRHPADIAAEPGWIEVRFPLDQVSIDLRRAGLDRDPGWVPWLGVVVRFVYA
jgi:hypothetical protein